MLDGDEAEKAETCFLKVSSAQILPFLMGGSARTAVVTHYSTFLVCWKNYMVSVLRHLTTTRPFSLLSLA